MFDWLRRLIGLRVGSAPAAAGPRRVRARYDAATEDDANRRHWEGADDLGPAAEHDAATRAKLRKRARYERKNNGHLGGMIRSYADDFVGTGPKLQLTGRSSPRNKAIEKAFLAWARASGLAAKLHLMVRAKVSDGEAFALLTTNDRVDDAVKLDLHVVEADLVADPGFGGTRLANPAAGGFFDGIKYDPSGNPVAYAVLREHPGEMLFAFPGEFDAYPADQVVHWFRVDRPGQLRGVPEITASLGACAQTRRWKKATILAAETAASLAAMMTSTASDEEASPVPEAFSAVEIEHNMLMALPPGSDVKQMTAQHPNTLYGDFSWEQVKEMGRPLCIPGNITAGDSSRSNFASAKLDHLGYRSSLRVEREYAEPVVLERLFRAWHAEASRIPGHPAYRTTLAELPHVWAWPGWPALDKAEAKDDTERLANGTSNLAEIFADWGQDWREQLEKAAEVAEYAQSLGLGPAGVPAAPEPAPPAEPPPDGGAMADREDRLAAAVRKLALNGHANGRRLNAYSDDQPRADNGQFGEGGGGAADDHEAAREKEDQDVSDRRDKEDEQVGTARDKEDQGADDARDAEDQHTETAREKEDAADESARDKEDSQVEKAREKEDAAVEKAREKEDKELDKADEALGKEREKVETAREKEDAKAESARDKEDDADDAANDKREAAVEKAREKEDAATDKARDKEAAALTTDEEKTAAEEKWAKEDEATGAAREKEDADAESARDAARAEKADRRDKEDAGRDAARAKEDEEHGAKEAALAEKRDAVEKARDDEDRARESAREREDAGRRAAREEKDAAKQAERDRHDAERQEQRDEQDAAREATRAEEDARREAERAKEDEKRGARA